MSDAPARAAAMRRGLVTTLVVFLGIVVAWGAWVGVRASMAKDELTAVAALLDGAKAGVASGDQASITASVTQLAAHADAAEGLTGDPAWRAAEIVPVIGPNLAAVRIASHELDTLSSRVIAPLVAILPPYGAGTPLPDLAALRDAQPVLEKAALSLERSGRALDGVDTDALIDQVSSAVEQFRTVVGDAAPVVSSLAEASALAPSMLGAEGARSILLVFQNSAELRSSGGLAGALVEFSAVNGELTLVDQASSSDFEPRSESLVPLPEATTALFGSQVGRAMVNLTMTPDFALSAELASQWWNLRTGHRPDTVVAVDPLTITALLAITGPLEVDGVSLTAENAAHELLVAPYQRFADNDQQDHFFESMVTTVFGTLTGGSINPLALIDALRVPVSEGRMSVWSAHPDEQVQLADGPLGGPLARQHLAGDHAFAVYFNDATGAKLDTFIETAIDVNSDVCRADGRRETRVSVTLTSTVPDDAYETFPGRMTADGLLGVQDGSVATYVAVAAPAGSFFGGVRSAEAPVASTDVTQSGYPTSQAGITLAPGESKALQFSFISAGANAGVPTLVHTPLYSPPTITVAEQDCP